MEKTIELTIYFCPGCLKDKSGMHKYCGECGSRIMTQDIMICMENGEVTRVLKK